MSTAMRDNHTRTEEKESNSENSNSSRRSRLRPTADLPKDRQRKVVSFSSDTAGGTESTAFEALVDRLEARAATYTFDRCDSSCLTAKDGFVYPPNTSIGLFKLIERHEDARRWEHRFEYLDTRKARSDKLMNAKSQESGKATQ